MGSFYFTPEANHTYNAIININNKTVTKPLPAALDKGYVMHLSDVDEKQCTINVNSNENMREPVYLIGYSDNKINAALMQSTDDNGNTSFTIQKNNLTS